MLKPSDLAVFGGRPTASHAWPPWPEFNVEVFDRVSNALRSGRWAVSGPFTGERSLDACFGETFAKFVGTKWCLPIDHGSSAIVAALMALRIGPGDEVIVPGLTWVACASAVLRVGAIPILVDIDADTLCLRPDAVQAAITAKTAGILVVHLFSAMAEMDEMRRIAASHGLALIEDAAQAHGATWRGLGAGSLGDVGTFSMQQSKVLTSGEGGAVVTSDPALYRALEQIRGDGRRYVTYAPTAGYPDLEGIGEIQGCNMHLSEIQSALLLAGLDRLPSQNSIRSRAAQLLDNKLSQIDGVHIIKPYPENTGRTYYCYVVRIDTSRFESRSVDIIARALSAELGAWVQPLPMPLDANPLYQPHTHWSARLHGHAARLEPARFDLREAHRQAAQGIVFHHSMLLAPDDHVLTIVEAVNKVMEYASLLPAKIDDGSRSW